MAEPREAFTDNPHVECAIDLHLTAVGPRAGRRARVGGGRGEARPRSREDVRPRPHRAAHALASAPSPSATQTFEITDGLGLRDHSWGPRYWQNIWWYRWLTVNLGPDLGFAVHDRRQTRRATRRTCTASSTTRTATATTAGCRSATSSSRSDYDDEWFPPHEPHHGHDRRPRLRGRRRRLVEHPAAQPPRGHGHPHHRGHDHVAVRRPRRRRAVRVPRPDHRWHPGRHRTSASDGSRSRSRRSSASVEIDGPAAAHRRRVARDVVVHAPTAAR